MVPDQISKYMAVQMLWKIRESGLGCLLVLKSLGKKNKKI